MLPEDAIAPLSLDAGAERPALSLYLNVGAKDFALRGRHTKLERVRVAANLRHAEHDALNAAFEGGRADGPLGLAFEEELHTLVAARAGARGAPRQAERQHRQPRLPVPRRAGQGGDRGAQARRAARQAGRRTDDPRQHHLGRAARRERRRRHLPRAVLGQGAHERAPRNARGPGRGDLRLVHFAAAPLRRSAQPVAAGRRHCAASARRSRAIPRRCSRRCAPSRSSPRATTSTSARWSSTGACAGWSRSAKRCTEALEADAVVLRENLVRFDDAAAGGARALAAGARRRAAACGWRSSRPT